MRLHRAEYCSDLVNIIKNVVESNRTPLIVSSRESQISNKALLEALGKTGEHRIVQLHLRDLANEATAAKPKRYEKRSEYLEAQHRLGSGILHEMVLGDNPGQLLLNFDQTRVEAQEV